jgi:hypothetical protein
MRDRAIMLVDSYGAGGDDARPPRIIAPLQHLFDPVLQAGDFYGHDAWWDASPVPRSGFSDRPRIVFAHRPAAVPSDVWEGMLYHLQLRLTDPTLQMRHSLPGLTLGHPGIDGAVTLLPA